MSKFDLGDLLEEIEEAEAQTPPPPTKAVGKKAKGKPMFDDGLGSVTAATAAKAMDSKSMAGKYKRQTVTLLPGQIELIKELAQKEGLSNLSFIRWLLDTALTAYENGERPEPGTVVVRGEARLKHWSSQE